MQITILFCSLVVGLNPLHSLGNLDTSSLCTRLHGRILVLLSTAMFKDKFAEISYPCRFVANGAFKILAFIKRREHMFIQLDSCSIVKDSFFQADSMALALSISSFSAALHWIDCVLALCEVALRFWLGSATSSIGVCFPTRRRRPGPDHIGLGKDV